MKHFSKECQENHVIKVIENGYLVSGMTLGDNSQYYCPDFLSLINFLARRLNVRNIGEEIYGFDFNPPCKEGE